MRTIRSVPLGWRSVALVALASLALAGCQSEGQGQRKAERIKSDPNERFTETEYGVKASPRITDLKHVPKGGGREQIGRPYKVRGKWYYPKEQPGYAKVGHASWYGSSFHGRLTANGEIYDMFGLSGAHPTFPLPSYARVTNMATGANVVVRINDRGPYVADRMMDLSAKAAEMIGYKDNGVGEVKLEYIGKAPLNGDDTPTLMASYRPGNVPPSVQDGLPSGVMLAMNETAPARNMVRSLQPAAAAALPGVRPDLAGSATTIDQIIGKAGPASAEGARVPRPTHRRDMTDLVIASYAPVAPKVGNRASAALESLAMAKSDGQRIAIGLLDDATILSAVRAVADKYGRLVADPDGGAASYALALRPGLNCDAALRELWTAGAGDAFVLRD